LPSPPFRRIQIFRAAWWATNLLLAAAIFSVLYAGAWEHSLRRYLDGFSDAIVPDAWTPEQKVDAILSWMRNGPARPAATNLEELSRRDPESTLNYEELLSECGSATNAFLNLARASDLSARRLLLLNPDRRTKHVVAEVLIKQRWIIVDPAYRIIMRDAQGRFLTRKDLQDPALFAQAISTVPNYPSTYNYDHFAHVRLARLPLQGLGLRRVLDWISPGWDEALDWNLLLERKSFFVLFVSTVACVFFLLLRLLLAWYADRGLRIPRFHLREHVVRAGAAFSSTPEIKQ
jgi:hypothetical protein